MANSLGCSKAFFCLQKQQGFQQFQWKFWKFIQDIQFHSKELYKFFLIPTNALPPCANSSCNWERLGILQGKSTKFGKLFSGTFSATSRWLETTNSPALDGRCRQSEHLTSYIFGIQNLFVHKNHIHNDSQCIFTMFIQDTHVSGT